MGPVAILYRTLRAYAFHYFRSLYSGSFVLMVRYIRICLESKHLADYSRASESLGTLSDVLFYFLPVFAFSYPLFDPALTVLYYQTIEYITPWLYCHSELGIDLDPVADTRSPGVQGSMKSHEFPALRMISVTSERHGLAWAIGLHLAPILLLRTSCI